ncbi:MAG: methyl-accepting chemotaxis protein [Anaerolineaceae bacterium]|nr:methyl-accepting chemotaxis protein [Anaerolineaceae bacterium]
MKKSISSRMVVLIGSLVVVVFTIIIGVAVSLATNSLVDLTNQGTGSQSAEYANEFNADLQAEQALGRTMAQMMETNSTHDRMEVMDSLKNILDQHSEVLGTYVGYEPNAFDGKDSAFVNSKGSDASGRFIPYWNKLTGSETLDPLGDIDTSDYYLIPKKTKADSIIEPYVYQGVLMTSFISPIMKDGNFIGIAGADTSLSSWDQRVAQIKVLSTGYAFLVSNSGIFISAPDKSFIGVKTLADVAKEKSNNQIKQMASDIQAGKAGHIETTDPFSGKDVTMFYAPVTTANWGLVTVAPESEMMASVNNMRNMLILIGLVGILLLVGLIFGIAKMLTRPIVAVSQAASQIAKGDLDVRLENHQEDEIGQMTEDFRRMISYLGGIADIAQKVAGGDLTVNVTPQSEKDILGNAFSLMIVNLRNLVGHVIENTTNLSASSAQLSAAASQSAEATTQITTTIQQVAKGISQQSESISKTAASVEQMSRSIDEVAQGAQEQESAVEKASKVTAQISEDIQRVNTSALNCSLGAAQAAETAHLGARSVEETIQGMQSIKKRVGQSAEKVREMGSRSDQIGAIVETIDDIASQTNLLALNAAIEAARAGEHGKGFAVVADEVRKLAERSSKATKEIGSLILDIQRTVAEAVSSMNEGTQEVERGVERANQSDEALKSILKAVENVREQVEQISTAAQHISASSNELVDGMGTVSAVVEENTASTEEMATNSNQVTEAIENIASVSEENSAAVEEVSASTEEMSAQVEEVTASAQSLVEMAETLQQLVEQFKL